MVKLARDDGTLLQLALRNVGKWDEDQVCHRHYVQRWRDPLNMPLEQASQLLLADSDEAADLRQNNPFAGFFSRSERQELRQAARE